jgi:hypothetical protein
MQDCPDRRPENDCLRKSARWVRLVRLFLAAGYVSLQFDCSWEQNVVFQMDVLMKIRLKIVKGSEELKAGRTAGPVS